MLRGFGLLGVGVRGHGLRFGHKPPQASGTLDPKELTPQSSETHTS